MAETIAVCNTPLQLGKGVNLMLDSSSIRSNVKQLQERFQNDGYLLIRNLFPKEVVRKARLEVLDHLKNVGFILSENFEEGIINPHKSDTDQGKLPGTQELCRKENVKRLLEGKELVQLMEELLGGSVRTFDYKWLRAVTPNEFTGCHMDSVYMGRGTKRLVTCWIPFMDIPLPLGGLTVCKSSNHLNSFEKVRSTYGNMDVDRYQIRRQFYRNRDDVGGTGWFTTDPLEVLKYGSEWNVAEYQEGDIVVFTMQTFHASTLNTTSNKVRISCDVRFQLAEEPVDERWVGENPPGHAKFHKRHDKTIYPLTMEDAKRQWGLI